MSANGPYVWSGRALQEVFVELASAVLHQCIRSLIGALLLRTNMDISARAISLTDRPQRTIWVTSVRMRREDRSLMEMSFPASPSNSLRGIGLMVLDDALTFHLDDRGKIWRSHRPNL